MNSLLAELGRIAGAAFQEEGLSPGFGSVRNSDRPDLAQFQSNGALAAAKASKSNPRTIAERVAARLRQNPVFARVEIAGPGFINLDVADVHLTKRVGEFAASMDQPPPETGRSLVIDFGGPNIAKAMHVGHLRSAIIGDSLQRLFRANGWHVTSDVHLGDWGLQMGQLISEIGHRGLAPVYFDESFKGPYPEQSPVTMDDLEELYPAASAACADLSRLEEARRATAELQAGRAGYRVLWRHFVEVSETGLKRAYESLGVSFDLWNGEAAVDPLISGMIEDLKRRELAQMSERALVMFVARNSDKKKIPPLILLKSDGAVTYGTTDLATVADRVTSLHPDLVLYIVDQRQSMHFEQVFRAAETAGLNGRAVLEHAGFGTMNGTDGKPFKTRAGGTLKLQDLIQSATEEAEKRLSEQGLAAGYSAEEHAEIARKVAIATIRFADLSNHRTTDYIFDLARFSRFEGRTGPYLQYAAVRIKSILRNAEGEGMSSSAPVIQSGEERTLVLKLLSLPDALMEAEEKRAPNVLCDYVFTLAQEFSRFYGQHHILSEQDEALRAARLGLCRLTLAAFVKVLSILGIEVPERM
jgi:arginyl-tRNA synthetase